MSTTITIYNPDGTAILITAIPKGSTLKRELMKEDYITLKLSLASPLAFPLGSYCDTDFGRYTVTEVTAPAANESTGGYDYELRLDADYYKWKNKLFKYRPKTGGQEASWSLTAQISVFMQAFLVNLEALGYDKTADGTKYTVAIDNSITAEAKALSFSNSSLIDSLTAIAEEFDCDWWVDGSVIHMGKCETGEAITIEAGVDAPSFDASDSSGSYATRLYVFGGTTNVPLRYRKKLVFDILKKTVTAEPEGYVRYTLEDTTRPLSLDMFSDISKKQLLTADFGDSFYFGEGEDISLVGGISYENGVKLTDTCVDTINLSYSVPAGQFSNNSSNTFVMLWVVFYNKDLLAPTIKFTVRTWFTEKEDPNDTVLAEKIQTLEHTISDGLLLDIPEVEWYKKKDKGTLYAHVSVKLADEKFSSRDTTVAWAYSGFTFGAYAVERKYSDDGLDFATYEQPGVFKLLRHSAETTIKLVEGTYDPALNTSDTYSAEVFLNGGGLDVVTKDTFTLGTKFTIPSIISAKVPIGYFISDTAEETTVTAITEQRLMLPLSWNSGCNWIDAEEGLTQEQLVESIVTMDDIYPTMESTVDSVQTYRKEITDDDGNGTGQYETFYLVGDSNLTFSNDFLLKDTALTVLFYSGKLAGMRFTADFHKNGDTISGVILDDGTKGTLTVTAATGAFELQASEDYGRKLPDTVLYPSTDDTFSLGGYDASYFSELGLVEAAEAKLLEKGKEYMEKCRRDDKTYTAKLFWWKAKELQLGIGQKVVLKAPSLFPTDGRESRVTGCELSLDIPHDNPQYTFGESSAYSRLGALEAALDELAFQGTTYIGYGSSSSGNGMSVLTADDPTTPTDYNVNSARRSESRYLSKKSDDTATGHIAFSKGLTSNGTALLRQGMTVGEAEYYGMASDGTTKASDVTATTATISDAGISTASIDKAKINTHLTFGDYASGLTGFGGRITAEGRAELRSLTLWDFLEVPELRYNRVTVQIGNSWVAPGAGIIETVTPDYDANGNLLDTGTITLHLEDGEAGAVAVDDICQGIWHNTSGNETETTDDSIGNFTFAGFQTVYFRITAITETTNSSAFTYALRPVSDTWAKKMHPYPGMHFTCYGNFTNTERQSCRYSTLTYQRFLTGVNYWEFSKNMITMQLGDLSNLSVHGLEMSGYSAYLNNIYMSGVIKQFEDLSVRMEIDQSLGGYLAPGETETVTVSIIDGYHRDRTSEYTFKVERDTGDSAADAVWNAKAEHISCGSQFEISFSDLHISESHSGISTLFYVTADDGKDTVTTTVEY